MEGVAAISPPPYNREPTGICIAMLSTKNVMRVFPSHIRKRHGGEMSVGRRKILPLSLWSSRILFSKKKKKKTREKIQHTKRRALCWPSINKDAISCPRTWFSYVRRKSFNSDGFFRFLVSYIVMSRVKCISIHREWSIHPAPCVCVAISRFLFH